MPDTSAAASFRAIRSFWHPISRFWDFTGSYGKTSIRLVNRGPGTILLICVICFKIISLVLVLGQPLYECPSEDEATRKIVGKCIILIDQFHRYGRPQAACHEPAGSYHKTTRTAICFEHKTQYLLIRAPYTRIVVFWHISKIPPMISPSQISCNTPTFYIAAIFVKYCYTTGSWLL